MTISADEDDDDDEVIEFLTGHLEPVSTEAGVVSRLSNLGLLEEDGWSTEDLRVALEIFQVMAELEPVTGALDDTTRRALVKAHGS